MRCCYFSDTQTSAYPHDCLTRRAERLCNLCDRHVSFNLLVDLRLLNRFKDRRTPEGLSLSLSTLNPRIGPFD